MLRRLALFVLVASSLVSAASLVACSDDDSEGTPLPDGGQPDVPVVPANDTESTQSGKIVRAQTEDEGVTGATVTIAGKSATTNASGDYEIIVPRNQPYQMAVSAPDYYKLLEQEMILKTESLARGSTTLLPTTTANLLAGILSGRKPEKGLVVVKVTPLPPCTTEEGATVAINPPGEAKVTYFSGSLPDSSRTTAKAGAAFSAAIYNVEVGVPLTIEVTSPECAQAPFPIEVGDVTYTGVQTAEGGEALSYVRVFIKDPIATE